MAKQNVVEGIKVQLPTKKLRTLLQGRIKFHTEKRAYFEKKIKELAPDMKKISEDAEEIGKFSNSRNNNPLEAMETKVRNHKNKATYFKFVEENLIPDAMYTFTEGDLGRLEVIEY